MDREDQIELLKSFLAESAEFLDGFESLLLKLDSRLDSELDQTLVAEILGLLHTFKGNSGMMGYGSIQRYSHRLEDLFQALQAQEIEPDEYLMEFLMHAVSVLRRVLAGLSSENPAEPPLQMEIAALDKLLAQKMKKAHEAGAAPGPAREYFNPFSQRTNAIRVDFERLDHLMNLMGELVMYRTRLGRVETEIRESLGEKGLSLELTSITEQIGKVSTELHEAIMRVRMLPIRNVFMRFPRMVRDLAREQGKEILLNFKGEDIELDKTVIDEIGEPLLHLIRNAIDHGIEAPAEREKIGKPPQGKISLRTHQESNHIVIVVEDDGKGIDAEQVREKARRSGLVSEEEIRRLDLLGLISLPGFSTAERVTEVSGRGLGMDVVKKSLSKISGSIEIQSEPRFGTRFIIRLPLTLAIVSALIVEAGRELYAIPLTSVIENVQLKAEEVHLVNNRAVARIRGKVLPLVRLGEIFRPGRAGDGKNLRIVIVQSEIGQIGLGVDSLLGQQEIVVKALDDYLGGAWGIAGATILGNGKVVLIIDVPALMEKFRHRRNDLEITEAKSA